MRCISCMREIEDGLSICSFCDYPQDAPMENPDALLPGTELRNRFILGKELGRGGFGITYIGYDKYLDCKVAIKEYYPQNLAARLPGEVKMFWRSGQVRDSGCQNVIREAQKMHRIGILPVAVHVLDVFYENNTAYIAMDYVEGITLKQYLLKNGVLSHSKCMELILPILDTMIQMHDAGIIHRDISPDNIMIQPDLKPRILDLGAAKDVQMESGNTILVARNGFSPMEQYRTNGDIGTWTDVYALCATMYYSLTGRVPPAAMDRSEIQDDLPCNSSWKLPEELFRIIQDGMRMDPRKRIATVTELRSRLMEWQKPETTSEVADNSGVEDIVSNSSQVVQTINSHRIPELPPQPKTGFLAALFSAIGIRRNDSAKGAPKAANRKPVKITVAQPDAYPVYADPDATRMDCADDEVTVLIGDGESAQAKGVLVQNSTGKRIEISKCCFVLGRMTNTAGGKQVFADCMIEDSTKHISRRHAVILFDGENFYLQDISGKNTTMINDFRILNSTMPDNGHVFTTAYRLYHGDCIQLADEKLTFHQGGGL